MDFLHSTMNQHIKGKHLSFEKRVIIQLRLKDGWSLDVCSNRATAAGEFASSDVVCTKTLYNYDLPEKLKRNTKLHRIRKNKKKLGRSIEERPKEINKRNEFDHWECDLGLEHKNNDDEVLLTLSERMSREFLIIRIPDKTSVSVMQAFKELPANTGMIFLKPLPLIMAQSLQIFQTEKTYQIL